MSIKKLLIIIVVLAALIAAALFAYPYIIKKSDTDPVSPPETQTTSDPAELQLEAESLVNSDPQEASDKYEEASQIYEDTGNNDKAAENAANAAAAEASAKNDVPPTQPPPQPGAKNQ